MTDEPIYADPKVVARIAEQRGCIGPFPCGRGAGAGGRDLPCECEHLASSKSVFVGSGPNITAVVLETAGLVHVVLPVNGEARALAHALLSAARNVEAA